YRRDHRPADRGRAAGARALAAGESFSLLRAARRARVGVVDLRRARSDDAAERDIREAGAPARTAAAISDRARRVRAGKCQRRIPALAREPGGDADIGAPAVVGGLAHHESDRLAGRRATVRSDRSENDDRRWVGRLYRNLWGLRFRRER